MFTSAGDVFCIACLNGPLSAREQRQPTRRTAQEAVGRRNLTDGAGLGWATFSSLGPGVTDALDLPAWGSLLRE